MAFNTPAILGGTALKGDVSCGTCHLSSANNPKLFVPDYRSGTAVFDTTSALFNPKAENFVLDPVRAFRACAVCVLSPYGNDRTKVIAARFRPRRDRR